MTTCGSSHGRDMRLWAAMVWALAALLLWPPCLASKGGFSPHAALRGRAALPRSRALGDPWPGTVDARVLAEHSLHHTPHMADGSSTRPLLAHQSGRSLAVVENCTEDFVTCPDIGALLAFKAANMDPFSILSSWELSCTFTTASSKVQRAAGLGSGSPTPAQCLQASKYVCSHWLGVQCDSKVTFTVTGLNLNRADFDETLWGNFSVGQSIPPAIGTLTGLTSLDLSYNRGSTFGLGGLIGSIPAEVSNLRSLASLNLRNNRFWGPLPDSLGSLTNLTSLTLTSNNFTGGLPPSLSTLKKLLSLGLGANPGMAGATIPDSFGSLVSLNYLGIQGNQLTGSIPTSFTNLQLMGWLDLSKNNLTGDLPPWLPDLKALSLLDFSFNQLTGSLPERLTEMTALVSITLSHNRVSGSIPANLISSLCVALLSYVALDNNQLSGPLPTNFSGCESKTSLQTIHLQQNMLTGSFPSAQSLVGLQHLIDLDISNNQVSGPVPRNIIAIMPVATNIALGSNALSGPMPQILCSHRVAGFNFSRNQFTGQLSDAIVPSVLARCRSTDPNMPGPANLTLDLSHNLLKGPIPPQVFTLAVMSVLLLDGNQLNGTLPSANSNCTRILAQFSASGNQLAGPIPSFLGTCRSLQQLSLAGNQLQGTIPLELRGIGNSLQTLELQRNQLAGPVPAFLNYFQQLNLLNLSHNALSGPLDPAFTQLPSLSAADLSSNQISGPIPADISNLQVLKLLDLHENALSSSIPISIAPPNLPLLTFLDLSANALDGPIPWGFANSSASDLALNLSSNKLSGPIPGGPESEFALTQPPSATANNAGVCGGPGYAACTPLSTGAIVGIAVGGALVLVLILLLAFWFMRKRNEWAGGTMLVFEKLDFQLTVDDILEATENFSDKYKLGRGGFGTVYRATLQDGRTVAIKRLASQSTQGDREFQAEMQTLGNIRHRNLVVLVAAYIAPPPSNERLLVYNFLSGGSLDNILSSDKSMAKDSPYRQWEVRRRIALDVARGLKYLHHDCTPRIIHRDMKPANVLMDDQLVAHVADFGLAREVDASKSHMSTAVFGTIGYLAPEYTQRGRLTFKSDVFAYGVLLLQLITGKQPTDEDVAERGLARWVGASATASVVDDRMDVGPYTNQILGAIKLGLLCTSRVPADRPSMAEVVHLLENLDDFAKGITTGDDEV